MYKELKNGGKMSLKSKCYGQYRYNPKANHTLHILVHYHSIISIKTHYYCG